MFEKIVSNRSKKTLQILEEHKIEPIIKEYLKDGFNREELKSLVGMLKGEVSIIRVNEQDYRDNPFDVNNPSAPGHVQRLPYPSDELNANSNAPADDPGIFTNTEVNR